jgi:flagellar hook protein FlgE
MSLLTSLSSGTSGLASASAELSVVSDNLANSNTVGFKAGRAAFEDALAQSIIGGAGEVGLGSRLQAVQRIVTQGALTNTGVATDLALEGPGYFIVRGTVAGRTSNYFTRGGQFTVDRDGYLSSLEGMRVQGFGVDAVGNVTSAFGDLLVGNATSQPRATGTLTFRTNLQADGPVTGPFALANPTATSNFSSSVTVFDSLGAAHQAQVYFTKDAANAWRYTVTTDGAGVTNGAAGTPVAIAAGDLAFDLNGRLQSVTADPDPAYVFDPLGAAQGQALAFDFGDPIAAGGTGIRGVTQFSSPSATAFVGQDGWSAGELAQVQIDKNGHIQGIFTNGQSRTIGQVAVAAFAAPDQLERMGSNVYSQTRSSGEPAIGAAGDGGRGTIASGALEQSNVDIAEQFVRMIAAQRSFEANSKTITTADQLLSELISMKR